MENTNRISPYEKDQLRKKYGRNNISGHEMDLARKEKVRGFSRKEQKSEALNILKKLTPHSKNKALDKAKK